MHPLFGRCFPVLSISSPLQGSGHVLVAYREHMTLRIPTDATNLAPQRPTSRTKLTLPAMQELILLAAECEELCLSTPPTSGTDCPQTCNTVSSTNCQPSARR